MLNGVFKAKSKHYKDAFYQALAMEAEEGLQLKAAYRTIGRKCGSH